VAACAAVAPELSNITPNCLRITGKNIEENDF
jgi:hypothetical protein